MFINEGYPVVAWQGISLERLEKRLPSATEKESKSISLVVTLMKNNHPITEEEWMKCKRALQAIEKRLLLEINAPIYADYENYYSMPPAPAWVAVVVATADIIWVALKLVVSLFLLMVAGASLLKEK